MHMRTRAALLAFAVGLGACSGGIESNQLGLTQVEVTTTSTGVEVLGFDASKALVGVVRVTIGDFVDPEYGDGTFRGRKLVVEVGHDQFSHQSPGTETPLTLPLRDEPGSLDANVFLSDARVAAALSRFGISFEHMPAEPAQGEAAYSACVYQPSGACGYTACYQQNSAVVWQNVCCAGSATAVNRRCPGVPSCSGGGAYGGFGCPSGQTPNCPAYSTRSGQVCIADYCGQVGPGGCGVCTSNSYYAKCDIDSTGQMFYDGPSPTCMGDWAYCSSNEQCCNNNCQYNGRCGADMPY